LPFTICPEPNAPLFVPVTLLLKPTAVLLALPALTRDWLPIATPLSEVELTNAAFPAPGAKLPPMATEFAALAWLLAPKAEP